MLSNGRFELIEQIDSISRLRKVLLAAERHLSAVEGFLEELEFEWRHTEGGEEFEN